jgi:hypothetical protein
MNISEFSILSGGILSLFMTIFHSRLYRMFEWKSEFEKLQVRNKRILYSVHLALTLFFLGFTLMSFFYYKEMAGCIGIAFGITLFYSLFWLWRTIWQVYYFKAKTTLHYVMVLIFSLLFISYALPVVMKIGT